MPDTPTGPLVECLQSQIVDRLSELYDLRPSEARRLLANIDLLRRAGIGEPGGLHWGIAIDRDKPDDRASGNFADTGVPSAYEICRAEDGRWGVLAKGCHGGFLVGTRADEDAAVELAQRHFAACMLSAGYVPAGDVEQPQSDIRIPITTPPTRISAMTAFLDNPDEIVVPASGKRRVLDGYVSADAIRAEIAWHEARARTLRSPDRAFDDTFAAFEAAVHETAATRLSALITPPEPEDRT